MVIVPAARATCRGLMDGDIGAGEVVCGTDTVALSIVFLDMHVVGLLMLVIVYVWRRRVFEDEFACLMMVDRSLRWRMVRARVIMPCCCAAFKHPPIVKLAFSDLLALQDINHSKMFALSILSMVILSMQTVHNEYSTIFTKTKSVIIVCLSE